ncbi:MAG: DUF4363 family protein [Firmicutes bacterium]|nr:DUF4363 family protein [Bacillota bacterium]
MKTRLFIVLILVGVLITAASLEQHFIQRSYARLGKETNALIETIKTQEETGISIDTQENIDKIEQIYKWWIKQERRLSMLARHFDLAQVSVQLVYAKNFIEFDNPEEALVGLRTAAYLIKTHSFNVGTSIQNVI